MGGKVPPYPAADVASGFALVLDVRCLAAAVAGYEGSRSGW